MSNHPVNITIPPQIGAAGSSYVTLGGGGGGGAGSIAPASGGGAAYVMSSPPQPVMTVTGSANLNNTVKITGTNPKLATDKHDIDLNELAEMMSALKSRLLILTPNFEKHEKYPVLKEAYDQYKLIEALLSDDTDK